MSTTNPVLWGLLLSSLAGGSTTIGGVIGVLRKPSDSHVAFLLGIAIGVMMLLSVVEMWIHNAMDHGWIPVTCAVTIGALLYKCLQPLLPPDISVGHPSNTGNNNNTTAVTTKQRSGELFRLGLVMSLTMTLHNLPEGFAVAFSSMTDFGPVMALAIAIHNIPEGIIVAAPVYAATGSRWKALAMAACSGLSEPIGALIALVSVKPIISEDSLHIILAVVGGIMTAVCVLELWPEGRKCRASTHLVTGIMCGIIIMGSTLAVGV